MKNLKIETVDRFNLLLNSITFLSQNLTNKITIFNQAPDAQSLKKEVDELNKKKPSSSNETQKVKEELKFVDSDEEWIWIFNLLKIRI